MFMSYGQEQSPRQGEIIRGLGSPNIDGRPNVKELLTEGVRKIQSSERERLEQSGRGAVPNSDRLCAEHDDLVGISLTETLAATRWS